MTYNVFRGTLSLTQSINQSPHFQFVKFDAMTNIRLFYDFVDLAAKCLFGPILGDFDP